MAKRTPDVPPAEAPAPVGKGRATPSRRAAQQARQRPLVPTDRRAAQRASRQQSAEESRRATLGLQRGEERYLPARDRGPQRRYCRDVVDARFSLGELLLPLAVVFLLGSSLLPRDAQFWLFPALYGYLALTVLDGVLVSRRIRRRLAERFGDGGVERGLTYYVVLRCALFRRLRTPRPQITRGGTPRLP